jgi:hypothetical protein
LQVNVEYVDLLLQLLLRVRVLPAKLDIHHIIASRHKPQTSTNHDTASHHHSHPNNSLSLHTRTASFTDITKQQQQQIGKHAQCSWKFARSRGVLFTSIAER